MGDHPQPGETDLYFMGGGQDNDQVAVVEDFHRLKYDTIKADTERGIVFLGVCGGYQLMGHTFLMGNGQETRGLGIINVNTKAPGTEVKTAVHWQFGGRGSTGHLSRDDGNVRHHKKRFPEPWWALKTTLAKPTWAQG